MKTLLLLLVAGAATTASAIPITWEIQGATFEDGGTASGVFTVDVDTQQIYDVDITTTAGSDPLTFPGATFTGLSTSISSLFDDDGLVGMVIEMSAGGFTRSFGMAFITAMGFISPLDNTGGSAVLYEGETFESICDVGNTNCFTRFMDIGGQVAAVPEPGTIGLSLVGALGLTLTFLRRKRLAA
jgi:hypothetical protein